MAIAAQNDNPVATCTDSNKQISSNGMENNSVGEKIVHANKSSVNTNVNAMLDHDKINGKVADPPSNNTDSEMSSNVNTDVNNDNRNNLTNPPNPNDTMQPPQKRAKLISCRMDDNNKGLLAEVNLNDGQLLYIREICQSHVRIGQEPVGYNLKRKIYMALYGHEYKLGRQLDDVLGNFTSDKKVIQRPSTSCSDDENITG